MTKFQNDFVALLNSDAVQSIAFAFLDVVVVPSGYRRVARAAGSQIQLERDVNALRRHGGLMAYVAQDPTVLSTRHQRRFASKAANARPPSVLVYGVETSLQSVEGRALAVHEATHAQFDGRRKPVNALTSEGAAYIAQLWYLENVGYNVAAATGAVREAVDEVRGSARPGIGIAPPRVPEGLAQRVRLEMATICVSRGLQGCYPNTDYQYDGF